MIPDGSSRALLFQDGSSFLRSRWYDEAMARASREPKVVQARARMRSGGLRERVRYWYVLSVHMNRPGYFEYKLASVLERLPAGRAEDVAAYRAKPLPLLFFKSPEVMASVALLLGWQVAGDAVPAGDSTA